MRESIIRTLTATEEAQGHFDDLKTGRNTYAGCVKDIRESTPEWLDAEEVEEEFKRLVEEDDARGLLSEGRAAYINADVDRRLRISVLGEEAGLEGELAVPFYNVVDVEAFLGLYDLSDEEVDQVVEEAKSRELVAFGDGAVMFDDGEFLFSPSSDVMDDESFQEEADSYGDGVVRSGVEWATT